MSSDCRYGTIIGMLTAKDTPEPWTVTRYSRSTLSLMKRHLQAPTALVPACSHYTLCMPHAHPRAKMPPHGQKMPDSKCRSSSCRTATKVIRKLKEALFTRFTFVLLTFFLSHTFSHSPFLCCFSSFFPMSWVVLECCFSWSEGGCPGACTNHPFALCGFRYPMERRTLWLVALLCLKWRNSWRTGHGRRRARPPAALASERHIPPRTRLGVKSNEVRMKDTENRRQLKYQDSSGQPNVRHYQLGKDIS
jgi:hypothetical protein